MNKYALIIQCHTNVEQVNMIIDFFNDDRFDIFLHVDKKSNIIKEIKQNFNVIVIDDRIDIKWADFSQVQATLKLFEAVKRSKNIYKYIHFISGQDYPVKNIEDLVVFFDNMSGECIEAVKLPNETFTCFGEDRYSVYYPKWMIDRTSNKAKRIIRVAYRELILKTKIFKRKFILINDIYCGSSWFSITQECMEYILEFLSKNSFYSNFFENSIYPDEMFFQTIIMNSKFKEKVTQNNFRYIDWNKEYQNGSPKDLYNKDLLNAIDSENFFARKIVSMESINFVNNELSERKQKICAE